MVTVPMGKLSAGIPINKVWPGTGLITFAGNLPLGLSFLGVMPEEVDWVGV